MLILKFHSRDAKSRR